MKTVVITAVVLLAASTTQGTYTYVFGPGEDFGAKVLFGSESILVAGGHGHLLDLLQQSSGRIQSTTPLGTYYGGGIWEGGIWEIESAASSTLEVLGGEIGELDVFDSAHVWLHGGRINWLYSYQQAPTVADRHIDIFCKSHSFNPGTGMLTGVWGDDSAFSIRLFNVTGYTPAIDNINFHIVPEPATMLFLGLGGVICAASRRLRA